MRAYKLKRGKPINTSQHNPTSRRLVDRVAGICVRAGGITIIISILLMLVLIAWATLPLWRSPRVEVESRFSAREILGETAPQKILALGCEEHRQLGYLLTESGEFHFFNLTSARAVSHLAIAGLAPARISSVWQSLNGRTIALGATDGRVFLGAIDFSPQYSEPGYRFAPAIDFSTTIQLDPEGREIRCLAMAGDPAGRLLIAAITAGNWILTYAQEKPPKDAGETQKNISLQQLPTPEAQPTQIAVNDGLEDFFIGCDDGALIHYSARDFGKLTFTEVLNASNRRISSLGFLVGGRSLVVGDGAGFTSIYFSVPDADSKTGRRVRRAHRLPRLDGPITLEIASARNRTYLAASASGEIGLFFSTNERVLFQGQLADEPVAAAAFAPKADGILLMDANQDIYNVALHNPHPEANWQAFFQRIWYEGYERAEYVWQSSGGTDDFEAKLSLVPLIFGTLKGALYALLFTMPIAVGAALYVSQFMHHQLHKIVKPAVEMMASLPSVTLGFLAALWLAPLLEKILPAVLLMSVMLPSMVMVCAGGWALLRRLLPRLRMPMGREVLLIIPALLAGGWLCLQLNDELEALLFAGDFKQWLVDVAGIAYDQRNAFTVGLAMSVAVIPIVFTIAEEAVSNVPTSLSSASLALGASPGQTVLRVILPTASPGIFSAMMIGFGRAVGETMIVLMATGNTPLMEASIFNGFRTLAANIAMEMPEAPVDGTLFRALFLTAMLLFVMTFMLNTLAELVRQRLRQRYGRL
jgi:phosphate transport system permease protein